MFRGFGFGADRAWGVGFGVWRSGFWHLGFRPGFYWVLWSFEFTDSGFRKLARW